MKEEVIIHFVWANTAIPAPAESLLAIWLLVLQCRTWYRVEWLNISCSFQADSVVSFSYSGHSIGGIWPVYFAAICSTLQPGKGPIRHCVSPFAWPPRMKGCQEMCSWTWYTASSSSGFAGTGRERLGTLYNVWRLKSTWQKTHPFMAHSFSLSVMVWAKPFSCNQAKS